MSPVSKPMVPTTWARRLSLAAAEHRYHSDGNSCSYSSSEEIPRPERHFSFMMNDDLNGRSYVDPWDMENYSFLQKQLENLKLRENDWKPSFESMPNDFYYVPLDNNGSPQYQYKHYVDATPFKDGISPHSMRNDASGLVANIDEYDFYNERLETTLSVVQNDDPYIRFSNPSRQSERSRFNNQDYHTYTPPSIIKDVPEIYMPSHVNKIRRRASVSFRADSYAQDLNGSETLPAYHYKNRQKEDKTEIRKSLADVKIKLNRRKSFHDVSNNPDLKFSKQERRKSVLDHPHLEKWKPNPATDSIPEHQPVAKVEKKSSFAELAAQGPRKPYKTLEKGILQTPESRSNRTGLNVSFGNEIHRSASFHSQAPLVYIYETGRRRRNTIVNDSPPRIFGGDDFRYNRPEIQDAFRYDPIEQYLNRPTSRYTMTNYGHLKIDYSCSWNYLDKCIAQRVCL